MKNDRCRFGEALVSLGRLTEGRCRRSQSRCSGSCSPVSNCGRHVQLRRLFRRRGNRHSALRAPVPAHAQGLRAIEDGKLILSVCLPPPGSAPPSPSRSAPQETLGRGAVRSRIAGEEPRLETSFDGRLGRSAAFELLHSALPGSARAIPTTSRRLSPRAVRLEPMEPGNHRALPRPHRRSSKLSMVSERDLLGIRTTRTTSKRSLQALKASGPRSPQTQDAGSWTRSTPSAPAGDGARRVGWSSTTGW
jgi:hypothetical protein